MADIIKFSYSQGVLNISLPQYVIFETSELFNYLASAILKVKNYPLVAIEVNTEVLNSIAIATLISLSQETEIEVVCYNLSEAAERKLLAMKLISPDIIITAKTYDEAVKFLETA